MVIEIIIRIEYWLVGGLIFLGNFFFGGFGGGVGGFFGWGSLFILLMYFIYVLGNFLMFFVWVFFLVN